MTDSADIRSAADRLQRAIRELESTLQPMVLKIDELEKSATQAGDFEADRAELARKLDQATASEQAYKEKESEFSALAEETTDELERVIKQVKHVLESR